MGVQTTHVEARDPHAGSKLIAVVTEKFHP
jgi:hypothetical protein